MTRTDAAHPSREETFAAAVPWVRGIAERLAKRLPPSSGFDADDLAQVGLLAAWDLAATWDPAVALFATYAQQRVIGVMIDLVRREAACGFAEAGTRGKLARGEPIRVVSLSVKSRYSERTWWSVTGDEVGNQIGECDPEFADPPAAEFAAAMKRLGVEATERERAVLTRYFLGDVTMKAIGFEESLSESRVSQMISGVVERARESLRLRGRTRFTALA